MKPQHFTAVPFDQWPEASKLHLIRDVMDGEASPHAPDDLLPPLPPMGAYYTPRDLLPAHLHGDRICVVPNCPQLMLDEARPGGSYELSSEEEDTPSRRHWRENRADDVRSMAIIAWGCAAFFGLLFAVAGVVAHAIFGGRP